MRCYWLPQLYIVVNPTGSYHCVKNTHTHTIQGTIKAHDATDVIIVYTSRMFLHHPTKTQPFTIIHCGTLVLTILYEVKTSVNVGE